MATINAAAIGEALSLVVPSSTAGGGDQIAPNGAASLALHFRNTNASARTITVSVQVQSVNQPGIGAVTKADRTISLNMNGEALVHLENLGPYLNSSGRVALSYTAVTGVTVRPIGLS